MIRSRATCWIEARQVCPPEACDTRETKKGPAHRAPTPFPVCSGPVGRPVQPKTSSTAARVSATQRDDGPGLLWPALALVAALVLVGIAFLLLRRKKAPTRARKASIGGLPGVVIPDDEPEPEPETTEAAPTAVAGEDMICPSCRRGYPPGTETCPHDETRLMPYREFAAGKAAGVDSHVCPTCGERYPPTVKFCGKDGTTLVPG